MTTYRTRDLVPRLEQALAEMPVVVLTGLRQTGKSMLLQHEPGLASRRYVSLDDFAQLEAARRNPEAFVRGDEPLTIDEAQRCPELLLAIKREVDQGRRPGRFLLSGSANFSLLAGVTESLAGRAIYLTMHPFSRREASGGLAATPFLVEFFRSSRLPKKQGDERKATVVAADVLRGGMPSVCLGQAKTRSLWFKGYEQTYLERDVRGLAQVSDLYAFRRLLQLAALRTGQVLKMSELARDANLNAMTATRYFGLMEASFVVSRMGPYLANRTTRLIKSPKLYLADSGLAGHLIGLHDPENALDDPMRGALYETYVAQNIQAILAARFPDASLHYWHIQGRYEVDFVIAAGRDCLAIEVKAASRWDERTLAGLRAFLDSTPRCRAGILAYNGTSSVEIGDRLWAVPLDRLLS
jgi:hypothetical protein